MTRLKLPSLKTVVEDISLKTAKLEKILAESQTRIASYLDIQYPDCQEIIFLLGGKAVKAGRFTEDGNRTILDVKSALAKLKQTQQGSISFYEISKLLMVIILGTFIFEPTHAKLKSRQIDFDGLLNLLNRKRFIGYLELKTEQGLNYLTFFNGQAREGYFFDEIKDMENKTSVEIIAGLIEQADEKSEINVYESLSEHDLDKNSHAIDDDTANQSQSGVDNQSDHDGINSDETIIQIYEVLFKAMVECSGRHLDAAEIDTMFMQCLNNAAVKHQQLFRSAGTNDDGSLCPTGLINFKQVLQAKAGVSDDPSDIAFLSGLLELAWLRLLAMKKRMPQESYQQCLDRLNEIITDNQSRYKADYATAKFLASFSNVIIKVHS